MVGYYKTKLVSGHGNFHSYQMAKANSPDYMYWPGVTDTASITISACCNCNYFRHANRRTLTLEIEQFDAGSLVETCIVRCTSGTG